MGGCNGENKGYNFGVNVCYYIDAIEQRTHHNLVSTYVQRVLFIGWKTKKSCSSSLVAGRDDLVLI